MKNNGIKIYSNEKSIVLYKFSLIHSQFLNECVKDSFLLNIFFQRNVIFIE
jgi:hypothetical protein